MAINKYFLPIITEKNKKTTQQQDPENGSRFEYLKLDPILSP